jgi:hypothetical protein
VQPKGRLGTKSTPMFVSLPFAPGYVLSVSPQPPTFDQPNTPHPDTTAGNQTQAIPDPACETVHPDSANSSWDAKFPGPVRLSVMYMNREPKET